MNTREKLARIVANPKSEPNYYDYETVDSILDALMEPGEGALEAGRQQSGTFAVGLTQRTWQAILTAIKEGND